MDLEVYNKNVFINCPFDKEYLPLLKSILFSVYYCGFEPVCALGEDDGTEGRLEKIYRYIENCRYSIHDISRIELNEMGLPRFNMPFELGLFFGAKRFGEGLHKTKSALVFEKEKYSYQKYISDINGIDTHAHSNDLTTIVVEVRNWLKMASQNKSIPGTELLLHDFKVFNENIPYVVKMLNFSYDRMTYYDNCELVEEALALKS